MQNPVSVVTFSVACGVVPTQHIRLVSKLDGHWNYVGGKVLECGEIVGAELPVWTCTLSVPLKCTFKYRYVLSDGTSFVNLSSIHSITPKDSAYKQHDGNFGPLYDVVFPTAENQQWLHSNTQLSITVGYPDYYNHSPEHPRLGLVLAEGGSSYNVAASLWNGRSKLIESVNDLWTPVVFSVPNLSPVYNIHLDIQSSGASIGKVNVLASQFTSGHGVVTSPVMDSTLAVIGSITFHYSLVTPFTHATLRPCTRKTFPLTPTLVGHRGSGAEGSRSQVPGAPRSHIKENTVLSFEKAGISGAHFVEFDAHLTADMVPVIYHDFTVNHSGIATPIHSLTLEEFKRIGSKAIKKSTSLTSFQQYLPPQPQSLKASSSSTKKPQPPLPILDNFPTLKETLQQVPKNIGFNVEIKYPMLDELEQHNLRPVDRNAYVDCILWDVFEYAKDREVVFSSFDPDICVLLARKQPKYPVLFLTEMGTYIRSDARSNSPEASIHFAKAHSLQGLVCPASFLLRNPGVVEQIKKAELVVATWGRDNNNPENVDTQLKLGVNGIIVDHVAHIAKHWNNKPLP